MMKHKTKMNVGKVLYLNKLKLTITKFTMCKYILTPTNFSEHYMDQHKLFTII